MWDEAIRHKLPTVDTDGYVEFSHEGTRGMERRLGSCQSGMIFPFRVCVPNGAGSGAFAHPPRNEVGFELTGATTASCANIG